MDAIEFRKIERAIKLAISHIIRKGCDDIFKPPIFSSSIEHQIITTNIEEFEKKAFKDTLNFIKQAELTQYRIGGIHNSLVVKDNNSFRQVAWIDPFDSVKYLAVCILLYEKIEPARISKEKKYIHSHRLSESDGELFDPSFGYDSFRARSSELSREHIGKWKIATDISNFFDRIGNHSLENHLLDIGCNKKYVTLLREMLLFWAGDRRSFGVPVGSDASRVISEAILIDIDKKLLDHNIVFVRYVDDYRIFSKTRAEAYSAIQLLTTLLADEGLSINSKKTHIFQISEHEDQHPENKPLQGLEHEPINIEEKIEVRSTRRASGRSSFSKYYREPGKEALEKIQKLSKKDVLSSLQTSPPSQEEDQIKLVVKYFIYAEQDISILNTLIDHKITSIFYICDALIKERKRFSKELQADISKSILNHIDWKHCAYPYQLPILRLTSTDGFTDYSLARHIVDNHKYTDNAIFFREAISLSYACLDRARMRKLSLEVYPVVPRFVQRAIYYAASNHPNLSKDEKRPLLKNMKQSADDWFIDLIEEKFCTEKETDTAEA
ncbi:RNA-directed DNA polymerase [Azotobacter chroococcum]|uniref:RNA-directed DNA polymerase n=1 Tax=Azotobacter chroococcum TaxID=353 RepID=UPI000B77755C|nr:RNA-directed DNA polymerase [Azotobacter chroococcum]